MLKKFMKVVCVFSLLIIFIAAIPFITMMIKNDGKLYKYIGDYKEYGYYNSLFNNIGIYRKEIGKTEFEKIADVAAIDEDKVIFINEKMFFSAQGHILYKLDLENMSLQRLVAKKYTNDLLAAFKDTLFLKNYSDNGYLYSIKTTGEDYKLIGPFIAKDILINEGILFFRDYKTKVPYRYDIINEKLYREDTKNN